MIVVGIMFNLMPQSYATKFVVTEIYNYHYLFFLVNSIDFPCHTVQKENLKV